MQRVVENVTSQINLINDIVEFIATSPDYLGCEWIGRLYVETWQEDFCEGSVGAMNDSYGPMLVVTLLMMLTFALTAVYIPVIKRERKLKAATDALNCGCELEPVRCFCSRVSVADALVLPQPDFLPCRKDRRRSSQCRTSSASRRTRRTRAWSFPSCGARTRRLPSDLPPEVSARRRVRVFSGAFFFLLV